MDDGRDEGLIKFEVGGEAVEVEDEVEWRIEPEGKLWRITLKEGRGGSLRLLCTQGRWRGRSCNFGWRDQDPKGRRKAKEGRGHAIMVGLCGVCRIEIQRVLVYIDVLVVYEPLCVFRELWPVSRP